MAGLSDTDPKVARMQIELLRQSSPWAAELGLLGLLEAALHQAAME